MSEAKRGTIAAQGTEVQVSATTMLNSITAAGNKKIGTPKPKAYLPKMKPLVQRTALCV
jgi:hypothetical protein